MTIFHNKTMVQEPGNKQPGRFWLNMALVILLAVTLLSIPADGIHFVSGSLMMTGCTVHLMQHKRWIQTVILETPENLTSVLMRHRRLLWFTFVSGLLCGMSGLVMLPTVFTPHVFQPLHCCVTPIHIVSGLNFLSLTIYHIVLHRNWFAARLGRASAGQCGKSSRGSSKKKL